jgi:hypothetical protein
VSGHIVAWALAAAGASFRTAMVTSADRVGNVAGAVIGQYFGNTEPHLIDG